MKKKDMLFIVGALAVVVVLYVLSISGKKPPYIPADAEHAAAAVKEDCKVCHDRGKVRPMNPHHPFKEECFKCHVRAELGRK